MATKTKRPDGLTAMAILWMLNGISLFITSALTTQKFYSVISGSVLGGWFQYGISLVVILNAILVLVGFLQILAAYGFWTGKRYSYRLSFVVPALTVIVAGLGVLLYSSTPSYYDFSGPFTIIVSYTVIGIFWAAVSWLYITKPRAKGYLTGQVVPTKPQKAFVLPEEPNANEKSRVVERQGKFYCRYCGTQNPKDAAFCESCGKKLRESTE
jgi:hypothetical protein